MRFVRNTKTLLTNPVIARDYLTYLGSKLKNSGQAVRTLADGIRISKLNGFSEYHSIGDFVSKEEHVFLTKHPMGTGAIIDVGANLGIVSCILAKRFPDRTIHAFEPNPSTHAALEANIKLNNYPNIRVLRYAVAESDGEVLFDAHPEGRATASIATSGEYLTNVPGITLDTYAEQNSIGKIAFLKIDVEGYEATVLRGAKRILSKQQAKLIYYEVCPNNSKNSGEDPEMPTRILQENGYKIYRIDENAGLVPVDISAVRHTLLDNWVASPQ
jgi:FkbM family methyltransferase